MSGLEKLPPWMLLVVFILTASERLWKAHTERRERKAESRTKQTKHERSWEKDLRISFTHELHEAHEQWQAECDVKMSLLTTRFESELAILRTRQSELLAQLADSSLWEPRYWRAREKAIAAGVDPQILDRLLIDMKELDEH